MCDPRVRSEVFGLKSDRKIFFGHAADPDVDRKGIVMPKSEKKRAKSYLRSYSFYLAQLFFTFGGTSAERVKVKPSVRYPCRGIGYIFCAETCFQRGKSALPGFVECLCRRKCVVSPADRLGVTLREGGYCRRYPREIVVLRDNKGAHRLPPVLLQNVYPVAAGYRGGKSRIVAP